MNLTIALAQLSNAEHWPHNHTSEQAIFSMATEPLERKLVAILYADVAGYSRLTGEDEEGTHRALSASLDSITDAIERHNGTVMHFAGDAVLADFTTVSDALICAAAIQQDLKVRNQDLPDSRKVQFRIGVNLGEVIVDRNEIYGDGVNVAARLETLAEPGLGDLRPPLRSGRSSSQQRRKHPQSRCRWL